MKHSLAVMLLCCAASFAGDLPLFEELDEQFTQGGTPIEKEISGYWAGHCVQPTAPDLKAPAIYVNKMLQDDLEIGVQYRTQSYYWEKNENADAFMKMSPEEVEKHPRIKDWFAKEQWHATQYDDGSLVNYFEFADGSQVVRELRVYQTEFDKKLVLKVSKRTGMGAEIINYCEYDKYLGKPGSSTAPGDNGKPFYFKTDWISNQGITFTNPNPARPLSEIRIYKNALGKVRLTAIEVTLTNGEVIKHRDFTMFGFSMATLIPASGNTMSVQKVKFVVNGSAPFELMGVPAE